MSARFTKRHRGKIIKFHAPNPNYKVISKEALGDRLKAYEAYLTGKGRQSTLEYSRAICITTIALVFVILAVDINSNARIEAYYQQLISVDTEKDK